MKIKEKVIEILNKDMEPSWFLPTDVWISVWITSFLLGIITTLLII